MLQQKIRSMDVWNLALPVNARRDHGIGSVETDVDIVVLRLVAEDGTEGWGEASPWSVFTGSAEASFAALDRYIRPLVVGQRLDHRAAIMTAAGKAVAHCTEAKAALESGAAGSDRAVWRACRCIPCWGANAGTASRCLCQSPIRISTRTWC